MANTNQPWTTAVQSISNIVARAWDDVAPSSSKGPAWLWPDYQILDGAVDALLRIRRIGPLELSDPMPGRILVRVLQCRCRNKSEFKLLDIPAFLRDIGIRQDFKSMGILDFRFGDVPDRFSIEFRLDLPYGIASIFHQQKDEPFPRKLLVHSIVTEAKHVPVGYKHHRMVQSEPRWSNWIEDKVWGFPNAFSRSLLGLRTGIENFVNEETNNSTYGCTDGSSNCGLHGVHS